MLFPTYFWIISKEETSTKYSQNYFLDYTWTLLDLLLFIYITKDDTHGMNLKILDEMQTGVDIDDSQDS